METLLQDLPDHVRRSLSDFTQVAKEKCGDNLQSVVLFGSAAEGRLRPTSDVNLILVFKNFEISQINQLREMFRVAHAAIRLNVMFILETEIPTVSEVFAVKFADIHNRHRVLFGKDPFQNLEISKTATIQRLQQVIFNLLLRIRERYALISLREEQLLPVIAEMTGPIRSTAATIVALEGKKVLHPKEALQVFTQKLSGSQWPDILKNMSAAREKKELQPGEATSTLLGIMDLLKEMKNHIQGMK